MLLHRRLRVLPRQLQRMLGGLAVLWGCRGTPGWGGSFAKTPCAIPKWCPGSGGAAAWVGRLSQAAAPLRALQGVRRAGGACFPEYAKLFMCFSSAVWEGPRCSALLPGAAAGRGPVLAWCGTTARLLRSPGAWRSAATLKKPLGVILPWHLRGRREIGSLFFIFFSLKEVTCSLGECVELSPRGRSLRGCQPALSCPPWGLQRGTAPLPFELPRAGLFGEGFVPVA